MVETRHVKTINILSFIIIALGFFILVLLLSGLAASGGLVALSALGFFNTGLNMEITLLIVPALVLLILCSKSIKVETSLGVARILSLLSFLILIFYGVLVFLGMIVPALREEPIDYGYVNVMNTFLAFFTIEAVLHFIIFLMASRSYSR